MAVGVSPPFGTRWFREAGGMAPSHPSRSSKPLSGRYLTFAEREEIALWRARGLGVREIARRSGRAASTISREPRRNAATRGGNLDYRATTAVACGTGGAPPEGGEARGECGAAGLCRGTARWDRRRPGRRCGAWAGRAWKGRRHGPRQCRRWARAWSPQQIAERPRL